MKVKKVKLKSLSRLQLSATPWTAAYQAPLSMGFSRQDYWSGVPLPSLVDALEPEKKWGPENSRGIYARMYECIRGFPGGLAVKNLPVKETGV